MPTLLPLPEFPHPTSPRPSKPANCCSPIERCCWTVATWIPICIVYGATLWAIYVNAYLISISSITGFKGLSFSVAKLTIGWCLSFLALTLYGLCIWSFSVAVFTDPGSPIEVVSRPSYGTYVDSRITDIPTSHNGNQTITQRYIPTSQLKMTVAQDIVKNAITGNPTERTIAVFVDDVF